MKWKQKKPVKQYKEDDLLIEKLAKVRGIDNLDEWLNPPKKYVHNPYLLDNIDDAVNEIVQAVQLNKKIQIVADIDSDGICSTGIMYNYLTQLTDNVSYVHAQRSDGHGIETVIDQIEEDTDLVIIVDSSSNSVDGCRQVSEMGKKIVIIDHHAIDVKNPYAIIVNCQQGKYPNKHLSGSAMTYKVCQVIDDYLDVNLANEFQDLSAIGLVADMMSVYDMENRYLIYNGTNAIKNLGIMELLRQSNIDFSDGITTTNISFKVAPIMGACARFDRIELALELVTSNDMSRITQLVKEMIEMNENRKKEQKSTVEDIVKDVDTSNNIVMVIDDSIGAGFRGLVATEIVEKYSKPVFVLSKGDDGMYRGSARSVGDLNLKSFCQDSGLFVYATGHESAHGIGFYESDLKDVIKHFNENLNDEDMQKVVEYDLELNISDIDMLDIRQVEKFSKITGQGFPEPKFKIAGIIVEEGNTKKLGDHVRAVMGSNNDTVKINCEDNLALMRFRSNDQYGKDIEDHFYSGEHFVTELEVVGSLNINEFYNWGLKELVVTKQVFLEDYKIVS